jgi:hypothetical protein
MVAVSLLYSAGGQQPSGLFGVRGRRSRKGGRSPGTGTARKPQEPRLLELVTRINSALSGFFRGAPTLACIKGWKTEANAFLYGCPTGGCQRFDDLASARYACISFGQECGGVLETPGTPFASFEPRTSNIPQLSAAQEKSHIKIPCEPPATATAPHVYNAFRRAIDSALGDPTLHLDAFEPLFGNLYYPARESSNEESKTHNFGKEQRETIFLSVASYRDENCGATVESAFANAERPELLTVGIVEQNCHANCLIGTGWGDTRRIVPAPPDVDCVTTYCAGAGRAHCRAGRVRLLQLNESESYGPFFARYIAAKQWTGQEFFVQVDSHTVSELQVNT